MRVYLTGFSGSGKTTVGKLLAKSMKCRFIDVDLLVEERSGMSISEIFRLKGEGGFRTLEQKAIVDIRNNADHDLVVALGGGALQSPDIRKLVLGDGQTAYLSCSARELYRRLNPADDRPLLYVRPGPGQTPGEALKERIRKLLEKRRRNYRRSHLTVSTTVRSPSQAAVQLYRLIRRYHGRN